MDRPAPAAAHEATTEAAKPASEPAAPSSYRPAMLLAVFGLMTGIALSAGMLAVQSGQGDQPTLQIVTKDQLDQAIPSLGAQAAAATIAEARQCRVPLAYVTVTAEAGATASAIRIRSGSFLSPAILATPTPQRVAIPFPAPYPTGKGVLGVEGVARGLTIWLTPATHYAQLNGPATINVVWTPKIPPC